MEEKKNPRTPVWKAWISAIILSQLVATISSHLVHQQMWEAIDRCQTARKQSLQNEIEHLQNTNHVLELILQKLQEQ